MLETLQSNILKGHGRDNVVLLPLRFRAPADEVRQWIAAFARQHVTSAKRQLDDAARFRLTGQDAGTVVGNFYLSPSGYAELGFDPGKLETQIIPQVPVSFAQGMATAGWAFGDPPQTAWEKGYQNPIHAMILLAANDAGLLLQRSAEVLRELLAVADLLAVEVGKSIFNATGQRVEHFGYADGISDPQFPSDGPDGAAFNVWDPRANLDLVLAEDRFAPQPDCWGSFLVYRKLEQKVKRFKDLVRLLSQQLPGADEKLAGALAVGRFPNGSPLTLSAGDQQPGFNDFDYSNDKNGNRCPFHSHIRKMNPRGGSASPSLHPLEGEKSHRIARRGITYGERTPALDDEPESGAGILFLCFQRSISRQFAFLQKAWADQPGFPPRGAGISTGVDPVVGRAEAPPPQQWPAAWDQTDRVSFDFRDVVTLQGGEFFFAPSLPFLVAGCPKPP